MRKNWADLRKELKSFSNYNTKQDFESLTVQELRCLCAVVNKKEGLVICKATFNKPYSRMNKEELVDALWTVRETKRLAPQGKWETVEFSPRVKACYCVSTGEYWTYYFNVDDEFAAYKLNNYLQAHCHLTAVRKARKFKVGWEVKCWYICDKVLQRMIEKDTKKAKTAWYKVLEHQGKYSGCAGKLITANGANYSLQFMDGEIIEFPSSAIQQTNQLAGIQTLEKLLQNAKTENVKQSITRQLEFYRS